MTIFKTFLITFTFHDGELTLSNNPKISSSARCYFQKLRNLVHFFSFFASILTSFQSKHLAFFQLSATASFYFLLGYFFWFVLTNLT